MKGRMKTLAACLSVISIATGCVSLQRSLITADQDKIFATAKRELAVVEPNFDFESYVPYYVSWMSYVGADPFFYVSFRSTGVRNVRDWNPLSSNSPPQYAFDSICATVRLSPTGKLLPTDRGEWREFPEMKTVWYTTMTTVVTNRSLVPNKLLQSPF